MMQAVVEEAGSAGVQVHVLVNGRAATDSVERFDVSALMCEDERPAYGEYRRLARELACAFVGLELSRMAEWAVEE